MTIEFQCPVCQKVLKTADEKAGVRANCPGCGEELTVPAPDRGAGEAGRAPGPGAVPADADLPQSKAPGSGAHSDAPLLAPGDTRPCPMCGKEIKRAATRCRFCGENFADHGAEGGPRPLEAGDVLTQSWNIFQKNLGVLVGATLVIMGIALVGVLVGY